MNSCRSVMMRKRLLLKPINVDSGGLCRCIKAGYYKMGWTNFTRGLEGRKDGFSATAIMIITYDHGEQEV